MAQYKPYPAYKDSGVEWLDKLPKHWMLSRLGFLSWVRARLGWRGLKADEYVEDGFVLLATPNIKGNYVDFENVNYITKQRYEESPEIKLCVGDVLLAKDGSTLGTVNLVRSLPRPATVNSSIAVITAGEHVSETYLLFLFRSTYLWHTIQHVKGGMGVPHLFQEDLARFRLPLPPLDEQTIIGNFLDRETARIDALIEKKQRLIDLLKEKRQAVIARAVTKGLDPKVPMKDSGVEWLGEVPAHWTLSKVGFEFTILDSRRIPLSAIERGEMQGEYPYYGASGIIDYVDDYLFDEDLILVGEDGANLLNRATRLAFVATGKYWVNNHAHILRPRDDQLAFWAEAIEVADFFNFISGSAQPKLTAEALSNIPITFPPDYAERVMVQAHLTAINRRYEVILERLTTSLNLLGEHRSALITAAVTGQIDVRDTA